MYLKNQNRYQEISSDVCCNAECLYILFQKRLGSLIFQEKDMIQLLQQLLINSSHPSLSAPIRLLYLDWLNDYLSRRPEKIAHIQDINFFLPNSFDGPETHVKKLTLLSSLLKNKKGNFILTLQYSDIWNTEKFLQEFFFEPNVFSCYNSKSN
jgi:hypothetical protein